MTFTEEEFLAKQERLRNALEKFQLDSTATETANDPIYEIKNEHITFYSADMLSSETIPIADNQFCWNDEIWVRYNTEQSARQHESLAAYRDGNFIVPGIIKLSNLKWFVQDFVNVNQNMVQIDICPPTNKDTVDAFTQFVQHVPISGKNAQSQVMSSVLEFVSPDILGKSFFNGSRNVYVLECTNLNYGNVLSLINAYIRKIVCFDEEFVQSLPLSTHAHIIFGLFRKVLAILTPLEKCILSSTNDRGLHYFACLMIDVFTDRTGIELMKNGRSLEGGKLLKKYRTRYPTITQQTSSRLTNIPDSCFVEMNKEPIMLSPFIFFYHLNDERRLKYTYRSLFGDLVADPSGVSKHIIETFEKLAWSLKEPGLYDSKDVMQAMEDLQYLINLKPKWS